SKPAWMAAMEVQRVSLNPLALTSQELGIHLLTPPPPTARTVSRRHSLPASDPGSKELAGSACLGAIRRSWHRPGFFIKTVLSGYASGSRWSGKTQNKRPMAPINPELRKWKTSTTYMTISATALLSFLLGGGSG